jgi:hypothetical protein
MVSAARFVRIGSGASLNEDGSPRKGLPGLGAGDAGPNRAFSRPPLARRGGQSRLHLPSGRASIRPWDG